jgi:hypothetical protein
MDLAIGQLEAQIDAVWEKKPHCKIDWIAAENQIRDALRFRSVGAISSAEALCLIDSIVAAHTRRGYTLSETFHSSGEERKISSPDSPL